jgi:hypothetical protein
MTLYKSNQYITFIILITLGACSQTRLPTIDIEPIRPSVGDVELNHVSQPPPSSLQIDVAINVFDVRVDESEALEFGEWIFTEIRHNESYYLPYVLRNTLLEANQWGAVRVLPSNDPSVDLQIKGSVLASDGKQIVLHVIATDSAGRVWLNQEYADIAIESDFPADTRYSQGSPFDSTTFVEPFQDIYNQISNSLVEFRQNLTEQQIINLKRISQMVYATDLAPESFQRNLIKDGESQLLSLVSLPAKEDPMIERVNDMRVRHHLFIDTVDEYYASLFEKMQPAYVLWRKYSFERINEELESRSIPYDYQDYGRSGRYLTLTQRYDRYRWSKIFEMEYQDISAGFNNEVAPAILTLNEEVHGLSGTMEEQYIQWRRILRQLFGLEAQTPEQM